MDPVDCPASRPPREYTYAPITSPRTTRVLILHPARDKSDALSGTLCSLELPKGSADRAPHDPHRPLSQPYEALSYVWGNHSVTETITLDNDSVLYLTPSIADALRRVRLPDTTRAVWADQICVNQKDKSERSQQVKLMGSLYRSAERVLVWLGRDPSGNAETARRLIEGLDNLFSRGSDADGDVNVNYAEALTEFPASQWMALSELNFLDYVSLSPPSVRSGSRVVVLFTVVICSSAASGSPRRLAGPCRRSSCGGRHARPLNGKSWSAWRTASSDTGSSRGRGTKSPRSGSYGCTGGSRTALARTVHEAGEGAGSSVTWYSCGTSRRATDATSCTRC